jgi:hypothetical protein
MITSDECQHHIRELRKWLADNPAPASTPAREKLPWFQSMMRARRDREISLNRWITKAQMMPPCHTTAVAED